MLEPELTLEPAADAAAPPSVVLAAYPSFTGSLPPVGPAAAPPAEVVAGLVGIAAVEGPVLGHRLRSAYLAAAAQQGSPQATRLLDAAVTAAVRDGLLVEDDPLAEPGVTPRTYRVPDQPVVARELGPRTFDQVPPEELRLVMEQVAAAIGWNDPVAVFAETMAAYGVRSLGSTNRARLAAVARLAR